MRRIPWRGVGVVGLVLVAAAAFYLQSYIAATRDYQDGVRAYRAEEWSHAIEHLTEAIRLAPFQYAHLSDCHSLRGFAHFELREFDAALSDFEEAVRLDPNDVGARVGRGNVRRQKEDLDGALADYEEAVRLAPGDARGYHGRGLIYGARKQYADAIAALDEAIARDPKHARSYLARAAVRQASGDVEGSRADYKSAVELDPSLSRMPK